MAAKIKEGMTGGQVADIIEQNFENLENKFQLLSDLFDHTKEDLQRTLDEYQDLVDDAYGSIVTLVDEEDTTTDNGKIKFKDRAYEPDKFSGKGYKILRKNIVCNTETKEAKNILTQDMINQPNTIYEIRYDFDLNGETITIPEGCTLKFEGGSLSNGNIVGTHTVIKTSNYKIFNINRTTQYISGDWDIDFWNVKWFGAIADGELSFIEEGEYDTTFSGTDNYNAIQTTFDVANNTCPRRVLIPLGTYRISKGLVFGWNVRTNCEIAGEGIVNLGLTGKGTVLLCEGEYGICLNAIYKPYLHDLTILGIGYGFYRFKGFTPGHGKDTTGMEDESNWVPSYIKNKFKEKGQGLGRYCPHCGVVIEGYKFDEGIENFVHYEIPEHPVYVEDNWYENVPNSTRSLIERIEVEGFCVNLAYSVSSYWHNTEFCTVYNSNLSGAVYAVSWGNNQARDTSFYNCYLGDCQTSISNNKFGDQTGLLQGVFDNCNFDSAYQIIDANSGYIQGLKISNSYAETLNILGTLDYTVNYSLANFIIDNCDFYFRNNETTADSFPINNLLINAPITIINSTISIYNRFAVLYKDSYVRNTKVSLSSRHYFPLMNVAGTISIGLDNKLAEDNLWRTDLAKKWNTDKPFIEKVYNGYALTNYDNTNNTIQIDLSNCDMYGDNKTLFVGDLFISRNISGVITSVEDNIGIITICNGYYYDYNGNYSILSNKSGFTSIISSKGIKNYQNTYIEAVSLDGKIGRLYRAFTPYDNYLIVKLNADGTLLYIQGEFDSRTKTFTLSLNESFKVGDKIAMIEPYSNEEILQMLPYKKITGGR